MADFDASALPLSRLPAGRHGLPRKFIEQHQRERIITALVDTVARSGYNHTPVADITKAAEVSRRTFYEHFSDKEQCFLAAYDLIDDHLLRSANAAADVFDEWPQKVRAALATLLHFLSGEPELARVYAFEPTGAGGRIAARHQRSMRELTKIVNQGRPERAGKHPLPEVTEETLMAGIFSLIVREIAAGRAEQLDSLLPDVVELTFVSYLGAEEAARLARSGPSGAAGSSPAASSPN
jgi:AcrR family transcriptional regulator